MNDFRWAIAILAAGVLACHSASAQSPAVPPGAGSADSPYRISKLSHLSWMSQTVTNSYGKYYKLINDIDAGLTANWNDTGTGTKTKEGFVPIGTKDAPFSGYFDGQKYTVKNITINRRATDNVGLFGYVSGGGIIQRVGVSGGSVIGREYVGGLIGKNMGCLIADNYSSLSVSGRWDFVGGLIGYNQNSTIRHSFTKGSTLSDTGWSVGGLVGYNQNSSILECYSSGAVVGGEKVGGLVGHNMEGTLDRCYSRGNLLGAAEVGGLVGMHEGYGGKSTITAFIRNSYSTRRVSGGVNVGGFAGTTSYGAILNCYSKGLVQAQSDQSIGGFVGANVQSYVTDCFFDKEISGYEEQYAGGYGTGLRTSGMMHRESYLNWDFAGIWNMDAALNSGYPFLRAMPLAQFTAPVSSMTEANRIVKVRIRRYGNIANPLTLFYTTKNKTALAGQDYVKKSGSLSWNAGDGTDRIIKVSILDDTITEPTESFLVKISGIAGADFINQCTIQILANTR